MTIDDITIPPFDHIFDHPNENYVIVSWRENRTRWFRVVEYDDLPNLTPQKIMNRKKL